MRRLQTTLALMHNVYQTSNLWCTCIHADKQLVVHMHAENLHTSKLLRHLFGKVSDEEAVQERVVVRLQLSEGVLQSGRKR